MRGGAEHIVNRARSALQEAADKTFLSDVVDQFRDELVKTFPLDTSGQIADFFKAVPLSAGDVVRRRSGIVYRMHAAGDSVRINFGTRSIVFPGFFREALDFALSAPAFAVRELPGRLEDAERIAFIERLMQEGLVVRA